MAHKLGLLVVVVAAATLGGAATWLLRDPPAKQSAQDPAADLEARLGRIEDGLRRTSRAAGHSGAQLGAVALTAAAAGSVDPDEEDDDPAARERLAAREAEHAEKERQHYDRLDQLARAGGGGVPSAQLRKNLEHARTETARKSGLRPLDVSRLECSDQLCRIEVRFEGSIAPVAASGGHVLGAGMGALTMRPHAPGQPAVFYVAAPGARLPRLEL